MGWRVVEAGGSLMSISPSCVGVVHRGGQKEQTFRKMMLQDPFIIDLIQQVSTGQAAHVSSEDMAKLRRVIGTNALRRLEARAASTGL